MPGIAGQRAMGSDVSKYAGAKDTSKKPPTVPKGEKKSMSPKGRSTGGSSGNGGGAGHDGVSGTRGGTKV